MQSIQPVRRVRRPFTSAAASAAIVGAALAAGAGTTALAASASPAPELADTGFNARPFALGAIAFLVVGAAAWAVASLVYRRAAQRAEAEEDFEDGFAEEEPGAEG